MGDRVAVFASYLLGVRRTPTGRGEDARVTQTIQEGRKLAAPAKCESRGLRRRCGAGSKTFAPFDYALDAHHRWHQIDR